MSFQKKKRGPYSIQNSLHPKIINRANIKALCNIELHKAFSKAFLRVYFLLTSSTVWWLLFYWCAMRDFTARAFPLVRQVCRPAPPHSVDLDRGLLVSSPD